MQDYCPERHTVLLIFDKFATGLLSLFDFSQRRGRLPLIFLSLFDDQLNNSDVYTRSLIV